MNNFSLNTIVNIAYDYQNHRITNEELIEYLKNIEGSTQEKATINQLIADIQNITNSIPIKIDSLERKRIANLDILLKLCKNKLKNKAISKESQLFFSSEYNNLLKEKEKTKDGGRRFQIISSLLSSHPLYIEELKKMKNIDLLKLITQYSFAEYPLEITQHTFDELICTAINIDHREMLFRLAWNYKGKEKDFSKIENYFLKMKDTGYILALVDHVYNKQEKESIANKIIKENDIEFISKVLEGLSGTPDLFSKRIQKKLKNTIQNK